MEINDRVLTVKTAHVSNDWMPDAIPRRRFGVEGIIVDCHDSHGECYDVRYDDGVIGCFDPWELELIPTEKCPKWVVEYYFWGCSRTTKR